MNKIKSFFNKLKNINIIFILSFVLCAGVISLVAFSANEIESADIQTGKTSESSDTSATTVWHKTESEKYEISSEAAVRQKTSKTAVKTTSKRLSKESVSKAMKKTAAPSTTKAIAKKVKPQIKTTVKKTVKKPVKITVKTTAVRKIKKSVSTTSATTVKKVKKKQKKTTTAQPTTTKAYSPPKTVSNTYNTKDISKETYTVKSVVTGKKIKSNGFDILCQIVNGEIDSDWNEEAIKAQAVAAYTYLRYCKEKGITAELGVKSGYNSRLEKIVKSVEGLVCTYNGEVINAVFCASTAGCSADCANVWGGNYPYLKSVDSKYDSAYDPNYGVTKTIAKAEVKKILQKQGVTLSTKKKNWIKIISNYNGKYVGNVSIDGQITLTGAKIRSLFGLKSAAFTVKYSNGNFTFTTYGYGHGVGMSQWGAQLYASKGGYKFDQILKHYYSGIKITL